MTPHFSLEELTASDTARARGIDNTPPAATKANLQRLAEFMEEVRAILGNHPITVTSGYRSAALNAAVGGVPNSAHLSGLAMDFVCPAVGSPLVICTKLRGVPSLDFDQLIHEKPGGKWVHIAIAEFGKAPRGEVWTIDANGTREGL